MARIHGRNGIMYVDIAGGGAASPVAYLNSWSIPRATQQVDVTAFGDSNLTYVTGLPDSKGTYAGFYDDATAQLYTAASDGIARKFYLYPDTNSPTKYWFGTAFFDTSITGGSAAAVAISGNFSAASNIIKV